MTLHLLDTDTCIEYLRGRNVNVRDRMSAMDAGQLRLCSVVLGDLVISAIALANGCTVVTHNLAEFQRVPGLMVEDWRVSKQ